MVLNTAKSVTFLTLSVIGLLLLCGAVSAQCPQGCLCMAPDDAGRTGSEPCAGETIPCSEGMPGERFCYEPAITIPLVHPAARPETTPPVITVSRQPEIQRAGESVHYTVSATDESGIAFIELWANNKRLRICFSDTCEYTTPSAAAAIDLGVLAADRYGNLQREGTLPFDATGLIGNAGSPSAGPAATGSNDAAPSFSRTAADWRESFFLPSRSLATFSIALGRDAYRWRAVAAEAGDACTTCNDIVSLNVP
ncbi:MAG: hypothetical protein GKC04_03855 [Methanomicrobiales archaeon]|nr:hypothetical protein [Methanomicrobiales archaeon]